MTLHEAIQDVLLNAATPLSVSEIAERINQVGSYKRKDGKPLESPQIHARLAHYKDLFIIGRNGLVELPNKALFVYREAFKEIVSSLRRTRLSIEASVTLSVGLLFGAWRRAGSTERVIHTPVAGLRAKDYLTTFLRQTPEFKQHPTVLKSLEGFVDDNLNHDIGENITQALDMLSHTEKPLTTSFGPFIEELINEFLSREFWLARQQSYMPTSLAQFIGALYQIENGAKVLDPFAKRGELLIEVFRNNRDKSFSIIGSEVNPSDSLLGALILLANGCVDFVYEANLDSVYSNGTSTIDFVVSLLVPYGSITPAVQKISEEVYKDVLGELGISADRRKDKRYNGSLLTVLGLLKDSGKAVVIVPNGLLSSLAEEDLHIRQYLVEKKFLKGIIALPKAIFKPFASINCSLIILDANSTPEDVFFMDATDYSIEEFGGVAPAIKNAFHDNSKVLKDSGRFSYSTIAEGDFNFAPKRFLAALPLAGQDYQILQGLVERVQFGNNIPKSNLNQHSGIPYIQPKDLPDTEGLNEIADASASYFVSDEELLSPNATSIPNGAVLLAAIGEKLKPTFYKSSTAALCSRGILVVKTNPALLLPEYLVTQFQSEYVQKQLEATRSELGGIPSLKKPDLLNVKIKMLSLEEQRAFVTSFYGKKLQAEQQTNAQQREDDLYDIISVLKHEIKQPVSTLGMDIDLLHDFLDEKVKSQSPILWDDNIVEALPGQTEEELADSRLHVIIERLRSCVKEAQNTLSKAEAILNIGNGLHQPKKIKLREFLLKAIKPVFDGANCIINLRGDEMELEADGYQLELLFKRLIENAIKHGFRKASYKHENIINIRWTKKNAFTDFNEIVVENNGMPFPEGFHIGQLLTRGLTSNRRGGTGLGGYHIKRIVENHKGEIYLATPKEIGSSEFKVRFNIYLP